MRRAGRVAAQTLAEVARRPEIGMSTKAIDDIVRADTARRSGTPSQLGYHGFPAAVCTSRNDVVCHRIPSPTNTCNPATSSTWMSRRISMDFTETPRRRWRATWGHRRSAASADEVFEDDA